MRWCAKLPGRRPPTWPTTWCSAAGDEDLVDDVREVLEAEGGVAEFVVHEIRDEAEAEEAEDVTGTRP